MAYMKVLGNEVFFENRLVARIDAACWPTLRDQVSEEIENRGPEKDEELESLREDVTGLESELAAKNAEHEDALTEIESKYDVACAEIVELRALLGLT
jgi:hypothetical protein